MSNWLRDWESEKEEREESFARTVVDNEIVILQDRPYRLYVLKSGQLSLFRELKMPDVEEKKDINRSFKDIEIDRMMEEGLI